MTARALWRLFAHPAAASTLGLLLVQQAIVASSSVWLIWLVEAPQSSAVSALLLYVASLILPYLPAAAMFIQFERWQQCTIRKFVETGIGSLQGRVHLWSDVVLRQQKTAFLASDGPKVVGEFVRYVHNIVACGTNTALNLLVVSMVLEPRLLASYAAGVVASVAILKMSAGVNEARATEAVRARTALTSHLMRVWDNVVLGNVHNHQVWQSRMDHALAESLQKSISSRTFSEGIALAVAGCTLLPSATIIVFAIVEDPHRNAVALVAILPRLFQILNNTHDLLALISELAAQRGGLQLIARFTEHPPADALDLSSRIQPSRLAWASGERVGDVEKLLSRAREGGRWTLIGGNGTGKSTALLLLKERFGAEAVYLPPQHTLDFEGLTSGLSTGQQLMACLSEIVHHSGSRVLLLDEWDANLDETNRRTGAQQLDACVERGLTVVEVRHGSLAPLTAPRLSSSHGGQM